MNMAADGKLRLDPLDRGADGRGPDRGPLRGAVGDALGRGVEHHDVGGVTGGQHLFGGLFRQVARPAAERRHRHAVAEPEEPEPGNLDTPAMQDMDAGGRGLAQLVGAFGIAGHQRHRRGDARQHRQRLVQPAARVAVVARADHQLRLRRGGHQRLGLAPVEVEVRKGQYPHQPPLSLA